MFEAALACALLFYLLMLALPGIEWQFLAGGVLTFAGLVGGGGAGIVSHLALRKALSERLKAGDVVVVNDLNLSTAKTKDFVGVLAALEVTGTALIVSSASDKNLTLASRNLANVTFTTSDVLNTYDVLRPDKLLFTRSAFEKIEARLSAE